MFKRKMLINALVICAYANCEVKENLFMDDSFVKGSNDVHSESDINEYFVDFFKNSLEIKALFVEIRSGGFKENAQMLSSVVDVEFAGKYDVMRQRPGMNLQAKARLGFGSIYDAMAQNNSKNGNFYQSLSKVEAVMDKFCKAVFEFQRCEDKVKISARFVEERRKDLNELKVKYEMNMISELEYSDCKSWIEQAELNHAISLVEFENAKSDLEVYLGKNSKIPVIELSVSSNDGISSDVLAQEYMYKSSLQASNGSYLNLLPSVSGSVNLSGAVSLEIGVEYSFKSLASVYSKSLDSEYNSSAYLFKSQQSKLVCEKKAHSIKARKEIAKISYNVFLQKQKELNGALEAYKTGKVAYEKVSSARISLNDAYNDYIKKTNDYRNDIVDHLKETGAFRKIAENFYYNKVSHDVANKEI